MIHMESLVKSTGHVVLGPTAQQLKSHGCRLGRKKLEYAAIALKQFRLLVEQLARVDPSQWSYNEELAFWIKLYNSLIMHAYLAYGVPKKRYQTIFLNEEGWMLLPTLLKDFQRVQLTQNALF